MTVIPAPTPSPFGEAFVALGRLEATAWRAGDPALLREAADRCAALLDLTPSPAPDDLPAIPAVTDAARRAALAFTSQFCVDVAALDEMTRVELTESLGPATFDFVQAVFVFDYAPRVRAVLDVVCDEHIDSSIGRPADPRLDPSATLWDALDTFLGAVGRIRQLDPVTSELVRLRGARQHNCRLCQSLRSRSAIRAGADDELFALVDRPDSDGLTARHRAALELTDAIIWHPARLDPSLVADARRELDAVERIELVLDVMRNAANKIAVALSADAPHVSSGIEIYDIDEDGQARYGLALP